MKIAFSTNAFKRYDLCSAIEWIKEIGYQGVEIMADIPHAYPPELDEKERKALKQKVEDCNLEISNLNAFMLYALGDTYHPSFIEEEETERRKRIEHTLNCIDLAADLGVPHISIEPGGPWPASRKAWALELFREAVEEIGEYGERKGVNILIEPEPELLIENSYEYLSFMEQVNSSAIGLNFDIGHFYCVGEDPAQLVKLLAPYTKHYHLEDIAPSRIHQHLIPGQGGIDLRGVLEAITQTSYQGFVTVELYPYEREPILAAKKALDYLQPFFRG